MPPADAPAPARDPLDQAHDDVLTAVVSRLQSYKSTARLVGDRVYLKDAVPPSPALPYLVVSKGRNHGRPPASAATLSQLDFAVTSVDDDEPGVPLLTQAAQGALNGWTSKPVLDQCVLTDTGPVTFEDGTHRRRDLFGAFHRERPAQD